MQPTISAASKMYGILAIVFLLTCNMAAAQSDGAGAPGSDLKLFDGEPKIFIVNGYSTSKGDDGWPMVLQAKLNRWFDGEQVIEVKRAIRSGTPISKWMNLDTGQPGERWLETLSPLLEEEDPRPKIILAQQSLQWVFGERTEGIDGSEDAEDIEKGADVIEQYTEQLLAGGADHVIIAMHIYKHAMEPQIGNERLALAECLTRGIAHLSAGPDVWTPTKAQYPSAFRGDKQHPNEVGSQIMAHYWFEALLEREGLETPAWSQEEMDAAIAKGPAPEAPRSRTRDRSGAKGERGQRGQRNPRNSEGAKE